MKHNIGEIRHGALSYCPVCKVETFYPAGQPHYYLCPAILIPIADKPTVGS